MDFAMPHCYQIYHCTESGWHYLGKGHHSLDNAWNYGISPKKIVFELFKINGGSLGYYLANLKNKQFYYCGCTLHTVKAKLSSLNALRQIPTSSRRVTPPSFKSVLIDLERADVSLVFIKQGDTFESYDIKSGEFISPREFVDLGLTKRELYQKLLAINGGQPGFYLYKTLTDEVFYFESIDLLRSVAPKN